MLLALLAVAPAIAIAAAVILRDRYEPEPRLALLGAYVAGGLAVVLVAVTSLLTGDGDPLLHSPHPGTRLVAWILFVGAVEELTKLVVLSPFVLSSEADEPIDFVVYGVLVALGFATVENLHYVFAQGAEVGAGRALLSVPAHAVFGTLMGLFLHRARSQPGRAVGYCLLAVLAPAIAHGVWDFLVTAPPPWHLVLVPFHLALVAGALLALESTALASPFRFRPRAWSRDPVRGDPQVSAVTMSRRLRAARLHIWLFQTLGILAPFVIVAAFAPGSWLVFSLTAVGVLLFRLLLLPAEVRDRRLVDMRRLVPAEAGGLSPDDIDTMLRESARGLQRSPTSTVHVRLDDTRTGTVRDWLGTPSLRRRLALPIAACRFLEKTDLGALITQRMALASRLRRLPIGSWAAPVIVTLTVVFLAVHSEGGIIIYLALLLWPAILLPFRLFEERLTEDVVIAATHLADLDAARESGVVPISNALLKLGTWADQQLLLEVHAGDLLRAGGLDPVVLEKAVGGAREDTALDGTGLDRVARGAGRRAAQVIGVGEVAAGIGVNRRTRVPQSVIRRMRRIDWRDYDTSFRDGRLDRGELEGLLERLRTEPELPLFLCGGFPESEHGSPTMRDRLLFLDANAPRPDPDTSDRHASGAASPAERPSLGRG